MNIRGLASAAVAAILISTGVAAPALADSAPDLTVTGIVARTADVEATYIIAGNTVVSIEPDAVAGLAPGTTVEAALAIPAATARALKITRDVALDTAKGAAVAEDVEQPFVVTAVAKTAPTAAASSTAKHLVDVAVNVDSNGEADGYEQPTDKQIGDAIATSSAYWVKNTGGKFPGFTVRKIKHYHSVLGCDDSYDDDVWAAEGADVMGRDLDSYFEGSTASHLVVIGECRHDGKSGIGTVGDDLTSGGFVVVEADMFNFADSIYFLDGLLTHEFGHNFSLNHANAQYTQDCDFSGVPAYTDITCDTEEYGDAWSVMGYTSPEWWVPLLDIARRDQLGAASSSMLAKQTTLTTKTYALKPLGASTGLKGVKILAPSGDTYYVEYRDGTGESDAIYLFNDAPLCSTGFEPSPTCPFDPSIAPYEDGWISPMGPGVRILKLEDDGSTRVEGVPTQKEAPLFDELALDTGDWWRSVSGDVNISINSAASGTASITVTTGAMDAVSLGAVSLSRTPVVGLPVSAVVASADPASSTLTYRWFRNGVRITGATASSYTPPAGTGGTTLTVRVEGRATGHAPSQGISSPVVTLAGIPTITGTPRVNAALTAVRATQVPVGATSTYQWIVNGADVDGATTSTFTPQVAHAGGTVAVRVTSSWSDGSGPHTLTLTSDAVGPVALATNWSVTQAAAVTGTATVGETLSATPGVTVPASILDTFQWRRDGVAIPGATGTDYTLTQADYGANVSVAVTHTATGYAPQPGVSNSLLVDGGEANTVAPSLSGDVRVGNRVSVEGSWAANFALSYQWLSDGDPISGATGSTYVPTASDLGALLSVTVTGTHETFGAVPLTTEALPVASGVLTAPTPTISGTVLVGHKLTAVHGTWTSGTAFTYRWYANGVAISGATTKYYMVTKAKAGKKITVKVTGTKAAYAKKALTSASKGVPIVGKVTITGTAKVGRTLYLHKGTWTSGTSFTYQWYASGAKISGATHSSYKITSAKAGKTITVHVTGRKSGFTTVSKASAKTKKVVR